MREAKLDHTDASCAGAFQHVRFGCIPRRLHRKGLKPSMPSNACNADMLMQRLLKYLQVERRGRAAETVSFTDARSPRSFVAAHVTILVGSDAQVARDRWHQQFDNVPINPSCRTCGWKQTAETLPEWPCRVCTQAFVW